MYSYTKNKRKLNYMILIIMILVISIGYAILSSNLNIVGSSQIGAPTWDIHWENVVVKTGSVTASTPTIDTNRTTVNYTVTFTIPGDYYEFTVDAVNAGSIDGMVSVVSNKLNGTEITTLPNYLEYKVTYDDGVDIAPNHLLSAGTSEKYKVHVGYKKDISVSDIPATPQTLNLSFSVTYVQSDSNAVLVDHSVIVYTGNKYISTDVANSTVQIGQSMSSAIVQFNNSSDVMEAIGNYPLYLKHKVVNGIVTESYVDFYMDDYMASMAPGITAGVYSLQGGGASYDEQSGQYNNDSIYFEKNKLVLQSALGSGVTCTDSITEYSCSMMGVTALVKASGFIKINVGNVYFSVTESGMSYGEGEALLEPSLGPSILYTHNYINNSLFVGEAIPDTVTVYNSFWDFYDSNQSDYCLKHIIEDGLISESYVIFNMFYKLDIGNSGETTGLYALKGYDSSAYESNKQILQTAFGTSNCQDNITSYSCSITDLFASASSDGTVIAGYNSGNYCTVIGNESYCDGK